MKATQFLILAGLSACLFLGCNQGDPAVKPPTVDPKAKSDGKGAETKKEMEDKNKSGQKTGASPVGKTSSVD